MRRSSSTARTKQPSPSQSGRRVARSPRASSSAGGCATPIRPLSCCFVALPATFLAAAPMRCPQLCRSALTYCARARSSRRTAATWSRRRARTARRGGTRRCSGTAHGPSRCPIWPCTHPRAACVPQLPLTLGACQAAVRSFQAREAARQAVRESWDEQTGTWVADAQSPDASADTMGDDPLCARVVGAFLFFYTPRKDAARARLVCQLMSRRLRGGPSLRRPLCTPSVTDSCCDSFVPAR